MRKVILLSSVFIFMLVFSLAAVNNTQAATAEYGDCTSNPTGCGTGLKCYGNPWYGGTPPTGGPNAAYKKICCNLTWGCVSAGIVGNATGLGDTDPREMAANVINIILGFLGIIAVVLILVGGFMWMTAAGNEEKTGTAKKIMAAGAVGLVIVLAAFGIAKFVISALITATA